MSAAARSPEHAVVYKAPGRFAGWPANGGIWHWQDEVVVQFTAGVVDRRKAAAAAAAGGIHHTIDHSVQLITTQARSLDGGKTWTHGPIPASVPGGRALSADEHTDLKLGDMLRFDDDDDSATNDAVLLPWCEGDVPLEHPDFALLCGRTGLGPGTRSLFYYSIDRCHSWTGPFALPSFGQVGVAARTDYQVRMNSILTPSFAMYLRLRELTSDCHRCCLRPLYCSSLLPTRPMVARVRSSVCAVTTGAEAGSCNRLLTTRSL